MKNKIWVKKNSSFKEAQKYDSEYYFNLSIAERISIIQELREAHFNTTGLLDNENGKRLRRVFRIIKQA